MSWQDLLAMGLFAGAALVVGVRAWGVVMGRGKAGCGSGCGTCGSEGAKVKGGELLEIGGAPDRRK